MPIYQYKCNRCGHEFELLLPIHTDHESIACTGCGKKDTRRVYSAFSYVKNKSCNSSSCSGCSGC